MENLRTCPRCLRTEKDEKCVFYKNAELCRGCIKSIGAERNRSERLPEEVERHRQERAVHKELKKIARKRFDRRLKNRAESRARMAREKLIPQVTEEKPVEVDAATKELASRVLQRRRLIEFVKSFHPRYKDGWVHHDICKRLEKFSKDVEAGKAPRLMILMPPRHGKSQIASKLYPAWHLGHYPHHEVIACSYNVSLALDFSREVRGVLRTSKYQQLFEHTRLDPEFQGAEAWKIASKTGVGTGGYIAAGIGGPINGKGAHVFVIDDPIKNPEEADSPESREKIWNWYIALAYARLAPGGGMLVIQTWWHDDDLAGRLQSIGRDDPEADQFEVVKYPAIAEENEEFRMKGEALHEARYPLPALMKIQRTQGGPLSRWWSALYQQNPVPNEGAIFNRGMFRYRPERPELASCYLYQAWDFAIGEKRMNDWTVGVTIAVDSDDVAHLIDLVRFKKEDQLIIADAILDAYTGYQTLSGGRVQVVGVEDGQIWKGIKGHLLKRMRERHLYPVVEVLTPLTDKQVRARPLQGRMAQKMLTFPVGVEWVDTLIKELLRFPGGVHDDCVDALSWAVSMLISRSAPKKTVKLGKKTEFTVAEKLRKMGFAAAQHSPMGA